MPTREKLYRAAERLHDYLLRYHYSAGLLHGPDAGIRFNLRLWRFVKSAIDFVAWKDDYVFMQSQGYWILSNWMFYEATGERRYHDLALECTEAVLKLQRPEGHWLYPLPERRNLIATVEGNWGAIGLLATHAREPRKESLLGAIRWYDFLVNRIGFQPHPPGKAINYFDRPRGKVPNNSAEAIWLFVRLQKASGDARFLEQVAAMLDFLDSIQLPTGELPYIVESPYERGRVHYLCFQYNAFEFLKLAWSATLYPDSRILRILSTLAAFLERGVTSTGASAADCMRSRPEMNYYTAVLAAALHEAAELGLIKGRELSERSYTRTLERQRTDGSFGYSTGDYGFVCDGRSYPRPQVMTLFHLLYPIFGNGFEKPTRKNR
jgi:hypothetical protein